MTTSTDRDQQIQKLRELIADIDSGMLTTVDDNGSLHSCPMSTNGQITSDGVLWFFIYGSSHKATEIEHNQQVNVSFVSPDRQRYISVSGTAQLVKDRNKMQEQWKPQLQTWFPKGLDEPDIALLKVTMDKADYWDGQSSFKPQTIS
ncbi:pyridoxamine 5'-phosphate oxidase family protein [Nostocaceae cyanobacterium CENA369]|jgi:general stress protein 26|uniref:Pyridoxamine 5'-phosphate oxidase family protein n=1 Tax=Dendronalium phyllosphericum CENA369 TaxID=1725256 RepID=A0A8J7I6D2_9NOST|nr:pyridoxamine 5'-phosphate oxidase family protein [Dendronalium phyllosphericum]MBH8576539.1 pyridoxamine 5'-phosphate oxidase family protein [Dendronalium phyllosphericum CENA369]